MGEKNRKRLQRAPELSARRLMVATESMASLLAGRRFDPALVRARLSDQYRDADLAPLSPTIVESLTASFDDEAWRRLMLITQLMSLEHVSEHTPEVVSQDRIRQHFTEGVLGCVDDNALLSMTLLQESSLRAEEFARRFIARFGARVEDEDVEASMEWLDRYDYGKLMAEAARAKASGEERLAYLKALQEAQEQARAPRGKW